MYGRHANDYFPVESKEQRPINQFRSDMAAVQLPVRELKEAFIALNSPFV
jgi:hypothetical protein